MLHSGHRKPGLAAVGVRLRESLGRLRKWHARVRPAGSGNAGLDLAKVEPDHTLIGRLRRGVVAPQSLALAIGLDQRDLLLDATGGAQVGKRLTIDCEEAHGGADLGCHVGHRSPFRQR